VIIVEILEMAYRRPPQATTDQLKFFQGIAGPNFVITQSIYGQLYEATQGDHDKMTDELMMMMIDPTKSQLIPPPKEEKKKDADHERLLKEQEEALVKFAQQKKRRRGSKETKR